MGIKDLLQLTIDRQASDLHLMVGIPPFLRIEGNLSPVHDEHPLTSDMIDKYAKEILKQDQLERFIVNKEIDFSLSFSDKARFRANAYNQKGTPALSFRRIPMEIPKIDELGLPKI
ncbi:type IV pili twitching motility protein PilT, partial [Patescibacteria group bacterium]|nr:type IV pili twitching motility protein PilT [Patescibacteria group bacterium]